MTKLLTKHYPGDEIYENKMGRACMGEGRGSYRVSLGKPEGEKTLARPDTYEGGY